MATKKMKKGTEGKGTGAATRKAIKSASKRGYTQAEIAKAAKRSPGVISSILNGDIRNPPGGLASAISKGTAKAKKKK